MKRSGSREKLLAQAATAPPENSIFVSKQATARQGDLSLSAPFVIASGTLDNLLPSQVSSNSAGKEQRLPVFTEEQRARLQKSRAERIELPKTKESSASVGHASASEHTLSNARKLRELQETQEERDVERIRKECNLRTVQKAREKRAIQEKNAKILINEPPARGSRSLRVGVTE
jgi:hypothetical protein